MNQPDEAALRRRLHEELDLADIGPVPADVIFRRSRVGLRRSLVGGACAAVALAVLAGLLASRAAAGDRFAPRPALAAPTTGVFASGSVDGQRWRLALANLADPGRGCLPGVVLNNGNGDLLQRNFLPGFALGNLAFLRPYTGYLAPGWSFIWLRPGVHDVTATVSGGAVLSVRPVRISMCGREFLLAGFAYPPQGVLRITATSAAGRPISYRPLAEIFKPASSLDDGLWFNIGGGVLAQAVKGQIGSGRTGGTAWQASVSLGTHGECLAVSLNGWGGQGAAVALCRTVGEPPASASIAALPYTVPHHQVTLYLGTVSPRTRYAIARLSDGTTRKLTPAVAGGRSYVALGIDGRLRLTQLTLFDASGKQIAQIQEPWLP